MPQIERCDECGKLWPRKQLVRKLRPYGYDESLGGSNLLLYSSYNSDFWTTTLDDAGRISIGYYAQHFRPTFDSDYDGTEARGSQTWVASGKVYTSASTDISSLTNACFSIAVGAYHHQTVQELTAEVGFCSSDGATEYYSREWTFKGQKLCYVSAPVATLVAAGVTAAATYQYVQVTISGATSSWWWDHACLDAGLTPKNSRPVTRGAARDLSSTRYRYYVPVLCPECAPERLRKPSEDDGEVRVAEWVEIRDQIESL